MATESAVDRATRMNRGKSLARAYVRGAEAAKAGVVIDLNPYRKSRRGFGAAFRRVWEQGFQDYQRGEVTA